MKKLLVAVTEDMKNSGKPQGLPMGDQSIPTRKT